MSIFRSAADGSNRRQDRRRERLITSPGAARSVLHDRLQKLRTATANSERIIGSERHPQIQPLFTRNMSRSSARADQFQDGVRCTYQWWRRRHHYHPKHYRFAGGMLRRFFYQIILADPVE
jgi:hypothetical protein